MNTDSPTSSQHPLSHQPLSRNFWNISNDEFYAIRQQTADSQFGLNKLVDSGQPLGFAAAASAAATATSSAAGGSATSSARVNNPTQAGPAATSSLVLNHAREALELNSLLFPTHLSVARLRHFHRPVLKQLPMASAGGAHVGFLPVYTIRSVRQRVVAAATAAAVSRPATSFSLVGKQHQPTAITANQFDSLRSLPEHELVLVEYSEQYPPLLMQPGMCTRIRTW